MGIHRQRLNGEPGILSLRQRERAGKRIWNPTSLLEYKMKEKTIICIECGNSFALTAAQQGRLTAIGFDEPKRCRECRDKKVKGGLSRYEEKTRRKNRHIKKQCDHLYNL